MPDDTTYPSLVRPAGRPARRSLLKRFLQRRSTVAFFMCIPLLMIITVVISGVSKLKKPAATDVGVVRNPRIRARPRPMAR